MSRQQTVSRDFFKNDVAIPVLREFAKNARHGEAGGLQGAQYFPLVLHLVVSILSIPCRLAVAPAFFEDHGAGR
jgi:hypothetical protein